MAARKKRGEGAPLVEVFAPKVRFVEVNARALVTLGVASEREGLRGCIVRVRMLPGDAPDSGAEMAAALRAAGVLAVKVVPAPAIPAVVVPEDGKPVAARLRPREVVEAMVAEAVGVDRDLLAALVGRVLDEERL